MPTVFGILGVRNFLKVLALLRRCYEGNYINLIIDLSQILKRNDQQCKLRAEPDEEATMVCLNLVFFLGETVGLGPIASDFFRFLPLRVDVCDEPAD